jgi:aminoglycoside/choline kinase family phosphotransferase
MKPTVALDRTHSNVLRGICEAAGFVGDRLEFLALRGDGSERSFFRVRQGISRAVALISPRQKTDTVDENDSYFLIGNHLYSRGVPVPRIYWADPHRGYFLLEDLGDFHLQSHINRRRGHLLALYHRVVNLLVDMQQRGRDGFEKGYCFDSAVYDASFVYQRELEYFRERFLNGYLTLGIGPEELRRDFENIAEGAGVAALSHVTHRDFQSRNIMISAGTLRLVDFQGMRFGPPGYDLASLLIDPYVGLPVDVEKKAIALYWSKARGLLGCSLGQFLESYGVLRLCRNLQVLGAYGYLGLVKGKRQFLCYVPMAWKQLRIGIRKCGADRYPTLHKLVRQIDRTHKGRIGDIFSQVCRDKSGLK